MVNKDCKYVYINGELFPFHDCIKAFFQLKDKNSYIEAVNISSTTRLLFSYPAPFLLLKKNELMLVK